MINLLNQFKIQKRLLSKSLIGYIGQCYFAKLDQNIIKRLNLMETPKDYYEELLKEIPVNQKGYMKIDNQHLVKMLEKCTKPEDIQDVVGAYYNFLGHRACFTNKLIDSLVLKALEVKNPEAVHDILINHNYLMYYPHPKVLEAIARYYRDNKLVENGAKFFDIIHGQKLLKLTPKFFEDLIALGVENKNDILSLKIFQYCQNNQIVLSHQAFKYVIRALYSYENSTQEKKLYYHQQIANAANEYKLDVDDILILSAALINRLSDAVRVFNLFEIADLDSMKLKDQKFFVSNELTKKYFEDMLNKLANKNSLYLQFSTTLKILKRKFLVDTFDDELLALISAKNKEIFEKRFQNRTSKHEEKDSGHGDVKATDKEVHKNEDNNQTNKEANSQ